MNIGTKKKCLEKVNYVLQNAGRILANPSFASSTMKIWGMWLMPGGDDVTDEAIRKHCICIGWDSPKFKGVSEEELSDLLMHHFRKQKEIKEPKYVAGQMLTFLRKMEPGDVVLLPRHSHAPRRQRDDCYVTKILRGADGEEIDRRDFRGNLRDWDELYCRPIEVLNFGSLWKKSRLPRTLRKALQSRKTVWSLERVRPVVEALISRLESQRTPGQKNKSASGSQEPNDRFSHLKQAVSYVLEGGEKRQNFPHHNYQVRLKDFLKRRHATPHALEEDFVDVKFNWKGHSFIGEIKVTSEYVSPNATFRAALGQILEYKHLKAAAPTARTVIFLDWQVDNQRVELASKLGIAVVASEAGRYHLLGGPSETLSHLRSLFPKRARDV